MAISFNEVSNSSLVPWAYIEFDNTGAATSEEQSYRILIIGQGLGTDLKHNKITRIFNESDVIGHFGAGSMLHSMFKISYMNHPMGEFYMASIDDTGPNKCQKRITITAKEDCDQGILFFYIAGRRVSANLKKIQGKPLMGQLLDDLMVNINKSLEIPFIATSKDEASGSIILEAKHSGKIFNNIDLRSTYYDDDIVLKGLSIEFSEVQKSDVNPSIEIVATDGLGDHQYNIIINPYNDSFNYKILAKVLEERWGAYKQNEGVGVYAIDEVTFSTITQAVDGRNSHLMTCDAIGKSPTPSYEWIAAKGAQLAKEAEIDPARPFQTLELRGVLPPVRGDEMTMTERNLLLKSGISTHTVDYGGNVRIESVVTNYTHSPTGVQDSSYRYVNTILTLSYLRWDQRNFLLKKYPRYKVASDSTAVRSGQKVITPKLLKAELVGKFREWEAKGLVENSDHYIKSLVVERNKDNPNRIDYLMRPDLINQLSSFGGKIMPII